MVEKRDRRGRRETRRLAGSAVLGLSLIGGLAGCHTGDGASADYPSLHSVPETSRPSLSIGERRQIVRGLLDERDQNRQQTAIVRQRSGLEALSLAPDDPSRAEDIIPDEVEGEPFRLRPEARVPADSTYRSDPQFEDGGLDDFIRQLKRDTRPTVPSDDESAAGESSDDQQNGEETAVEPSTTEEPNAADVSALLSAPLVPVPAFAAIRHPPWLDDGMPAVRLAAAEDEPGFFCGWFGWTVAWSSMCVEEVTTPPEDDEEGVSADLEQELRSSPEESGAEIATETQPPSESETRRERAERRLSEEDAAEAIENAGRSALAPVTSSLEKLRNYLDSRRSSDPVSSSPPRTPSRQTTDPSSRVAVIDRPPVPRGRPERREDIVVVDRGETFEFFRTPRPAFKPTPDLPVILPPEGQRVIDPPLRPRPASPPRPQTRPDVSPVVGADPAPSTEAEPSQERQDALALAADVENRAVPEPEPESALDAASSPPIEAVPGPSPAEPEERTAAPEPSLAQPEEQAKTPEPLPMQPEEQAPVPELPPAAPEPQALARADPEQPSPSLPASTAPAVAPEPASPSSPALSSWSDSEAQPTVIIRFEPETPGLPEGAAADLAALLVEARDRDGQIFIIGEASTNHLARRRAKDVGAALVQLGATVEILEYDHEAIAGFDQVRLVLTSDAGLPQALTSEPSPIEK